MATEEINIKVKSDISETTKDAAGLAGEFKIMGVSLNSVKGAFASMAGVAKKSFATWKERGRPSWYENMTQNQNDTMIGCSGN